MKRWFFRSVIFLFTATIVVGCWAYWELKASLPHLNGVVTVDSARYPTEIGRDALGTAVIHAQDRSEAARALGFVHAQERFFQMDLMRRRAAGELSALVGKAAMPLDASVRVHQLRMHANDIVSLLKPEEKIILDAYVQGVNEGLHRLGSKPFEYWVLRQSPAEWQAADSVLCAYSMYLVLQSSTPDKELARQLVRQMIPEALYTFLRAPGSQWDAPLWGEPLLPNNAPAKEALANWQPEINLPLQKSNSIEPAFPGSNSWAVGGALTPTGSGILQNDMHLGLQVPNIWFRAQMSFKEQNKTHTLTGVTLPGAPMLIAGSNGQIAWGFTNSYGDYSDVVKLTLNEAGEYLTPNGYLALSKDLERIEASDGTHTELSVEKTIWGPVVHVAADGQKYVFRWVAHDAEHALNFRFFELEKSDNVLQAISLAQQTRMPSQNLLVTDQSGNVAWTIIGAIPKRENCLGDEPVSFAEGECRWNGYLSPEEYPLVLNPSQHRLWTANNRIASGAALTKLGDGGYDLGARARQIRDGLFAHEKLTEQDLLAIALDDRALLLSPWKDHLVQLLKQKTGEQDPLYAALLNVLEKENELKASKDSVAYRFVRAYRYMLRDTLYRAWLKNVYDVNPDFKIGWLSNQWEGIVWKSITEQPQQLLPKPFKTWQALEMQVLDATFQSLNIIDESSLASNTWGARNVAKIQHPLSKFIPILGKYLNAPEDPLNGDANMPRVTAPSFGASERMVVSPGHEAQGFFHMPGGQSGHPFSPFYLSGHAAWVNGEPTPFNPGAIEYTLKLTPPVTH